MPRHLSAEDVCAEYEATMGHELGALFCALWNEFMRLQMTWSEYRELFGRSPERIDLLNAAAGLSFRIVQDVLWESTLLRLCRLTDPPDTGGKDNLTLQRLPPLVDPRIRGSTERFLTAATASTAFARDWRNRRIAHADLGLALQRPVTPLADASRRDVGDALKAIAALLNHLESHYRQGATVVYDDYTNPDGAIALLHIIRDGLEARAAQRKRFEQGKPLPEDLGPPRPL